jgi:hypothetical protein
MSGEEPVEAAPPRAENGTEHEARASEVGKTAAWYYAIGWWAIGAFYLVGWLVSLTVVGLERGQRIFDRAVWFATRGQPPPGQKDSYARAVGVPLARLAPASRQRPLALRLVWLVLVGWWLSAGWVLGCWAMQWPPYPFTVLSIKLARRVPEVMTLARMEATA